MTLDLRRIEFSLSDTSDILSFSGLRVNAVVVNPGGNIGLGTAQIRVFGLSMDTMRRFSAAGANMIAIENKTLSIRAGSGSGALTQIFQGTIFTAYPDFSGMPDVSFVMVAASGLYQQVKPAAAQYYPGAQKASEIIAALAAKAGLKFVDTSGVSAVVQGRYVYGSYVDQMRSIANDAQIPLVIENGTVYIWENSGARDGLVIDVNPQNGLDGYPTYQESGFEITTLFNPMLANGRSVNLNSDLPHARGVWQIQNVTHNLDANDPQGENWFSHTTLTRALYVN